MDNVRELIATMLMVPPDQIASETSLGALQTSLTATRLRLGLKRLGLSLPDGKVPATFGDLEAALSGKPVSHALPAIAPASAPPSAVQVGLDVQDVRSLPMAADYWEHEFYRGVFAKTEIAYAVVQPEPRIHLAGFWCAKEALRKCDASFASVALDATAVAHDGTGRPYLQWNGVRLPHALSLSHTSEIATAVVVSVAPEATRSR
jgi:phosphopantetheinyl transferase (holo-ACP synthase)